MTMKELEEKTGLAAHTIRYYEQEGIIKFDRKPSGHRECTEENVSWLLFIKQLRQADKNIEEIKQYASLYYQKEAKLEERVMLLQQFVQTLAQKTKTLHNAEKALSKYLADEQKKLKMYNKQKAKQKK